MRALSLAAFATLLLLAGACPATATAQAPVADDPPAEQWDVPPEGWEDELPADEHPAPEQPVPREPPPLVTLPPVVPEMLGHEPLLEELPRVTSRFVAGTTARVRTDGKAAIPRGVPPRVRALIAQYNRIVGKRYKWGGGHRRLEDRGYDCSGAVSYRLVRTGMLSTTLVSGGFRRWAAPGAGRWVTVYAHRRHVYVEVAGLRLDTSPIGDRSGARGVRWRPVIGQRRGFSVRHPVSL